VSVVRSVTRPTESTTTRRTLPINAATNRSFASTGAPDAVSACGNLRSVAWSRIALVSDSSVQKMLTSGVRSVVVVVAAALRKIVTSAS